MNTTPTRPLSVDEARREAMINYVMERDKRTRIEAIGILSKMNISDQVRLELAIPRKGNHSYDYRPFGER